MASPTRTKRVNSEGKSRKRSSQEEYKHIWDPTRTFTRRQKVWEAFPRAKLNKLTGGKSKLTFGVGRGGHREVTIEVEEDDYRLVVYRLLCEKYPEGKDITCGKVYEVFQDVLKTENSSSHIKAAFVEFLSKHHEAFAEQFHKKIREGGYAHALTIQSDGEAAGSPLSGAATHSLPSSPLLLPDTPNTALPDCRLEMIAEGEDSSSGSSREMSYDEELQAVCRSLLPLHTQ